MKKFRLFAAAIAVTALALTGCSSSNKETEAPKETQAKETQAPETQAAETQAPETQAPETQAAVAETEAAVVETEAAVVETEAAVVETEAAVVETEVAETEEKVVETEVAETEEKVVETEAVETEEKVEETEEVVETEEAVETEEKVEETEEVVETEEAEETEEVVETEEAEETEEVVETEEAEETEEVVETEEEALGDVMTYQEYADADTDTLVTIEAYVQGKQKFYEDNKDVGTSTVTLYAQDKDGGYFLYNVPVTEADYARIKEGTKIRFTGYKSEWAGEVEIMPDSLTPIEVIRGDIYISKPVDVTDVMDDEDALAEYMNQRVLFTGLTIEPNYALEEETEEGTEAEADNETEAETEEAEVAFMYGWDGSGSEGDDLYFNASVDGKVYTFVVESDLCDEDSEVYQTVKNLKVGDQVDLEGFLYWYEGPQPHIINVILPEEEE